MSSKIIHLLRVFSFSILSITGLGLFSQNATVTEGFHEIITYPYSDPNPIATVGKIYPYFKFDGYAHEGNLQKWKVITLENAYIKLFVTPEIGGKIWGAQEKSSGKMFIYNNDVVKFRNIGMRGPWTSGGIESNFGIIGHTPTGSSPIDYITKNNEDGSVSCYIGALDLITSTNWQVEIRLSKDKAYFETNVLWHNSTALNQPYYHWMTGAAKASNDLEFFFPGNAHIFHDGKAFPWHLDKDNHNLAKYAENDFGSYKSYHVLGEYAGFFGGYYHKDQMGFGNWSTYTDKPGKKLWIWGLSRQGMIWEDLLTDNSGQYIEMQTGRLFNQAAASSSLTPFKHREFAAYTTDSWNEIWFPLKETKGMDAATKLGVLNMVSEQDQLKIYFSPLQNINDEFSINIAGKKIYSKHLKLNPLELFSDSIQLKEVTDFHVNLGSKKISYSTVDKQTNTLNRPLQSPDDFDWKSAQGLAIKGKEALRQLNYKEAIISFKKCLEKDPNYLDALTGLAELYYHRMEYTIALNYAKHALSINTYDGASNFIYGLINRKLNFIPDAKDGFSIAAHNSKERSAAFTQLAELSILHKQWAEATNYALQALDFNKKNLSAYQTLIIAQRKQQLNEATKASIDELIKINPLNHFGRFENFLLSKTEQDLLNFNKFIRNELPHETYLDLAIKYYNVGLYHESLEVLTNANSSPIIDYWKAYLQHKLGLQNESLTLVKDTENHNPELVFPFRSETLKVLDWASAIRKDWQLNYYKALILIKKGQTEKGIELLNACGTTPDYAPFYLTRANILKISSIEKAISDIEKAIDISNDNRRAWVMLSEFQLLHNKPTESFTAIESIYKNHPMIAEWLFHMQRLYFALKNTKIV